MTNRFSEISLTCLSVFYLCQCTHQDTTSSSDPFSLKDDFETESSVEPVEITDSYIEYEPGQLPWADPDVSVRFHRYAEIASYAPDHPGYPDRVLMHHDSEAFFLLDDGVHTNHGLMIYSWHQALRSGSIFLPESPPDYIFNQRREVWTHHYAGLYLPEMLEVHGKSSSVLHLFECSNQTNATRHVYKLNDFYVSCLQHGHLIIHIPEDSLQTDDFKCEVHNYATYRNHTRRGNLNFYDGACNDSSNNTFTNDIRVVTWIGQTPPTANAEKHGYTYFAYIAHPPRIRYVRDHCDELAYNYNAEKCEEAMRHSRTILTYFEKGL